MYPDSMGKNLWREKTIISRFGKHLTIRFEIFCQYLPYDIISGSFTQVSRNNIFKSQKPKLRQLNSYLALRLTLLQKTPVEVIQNPGKIIIKPKHTYYSSRQSFSGIITIIHLQTCSSSIWGTMFK